MVMIVIYGIKECLNPIKLQLSNVLQQCLNSEISYLDDKRAHRFVPLERDDFFYPEGEQKFTLTRKSNMMEGASGRIPKSASD